MEILKDYAKCDGLIIKVEKTQAKYIGSLSSSDYYNHFFILDKKRLFVTFSIVITDDEDNNYKYNFQPKIATLKTRLIIWKQRKLSLKGKITIPNN